MKIGIVITCCNEVEYTKNAIASIKTVHPYELIVIDDYSIDGTKAYLGSLEKELDNLTVVTDADTYSLGEKWNIGAQLSKDMDCEAVLICNNDILFNEHTIDNLVGRMQHALDQDELIGVVSANNQRGHLKPEEIYSLEILLPGSEAEHPDFSCFLLNLKVWEFVGKFSHDYKPCYFEDNDFHTRLQLWGIRAIATTLAPYYHYGSVTQNSVEGGLCKGPQFEANRQVFVDKFGSTPDKVNLVNLRQKLHITPVSSLKLLV